MTQTLTDRVKAVKNTPNTGEQVSVAEINDAFDRFDAHFIPAAELQNTTTQSIPDNTVTKLLYNALGYDSYSARSEGPMASVANDEITIRKSGLYIVAVSGTIALSATGVRRIGIAKNGTTVVTSQVTPSAGGGSALYISKPMSLVATDIITGTLFQNSGGALNLTNGSFAEGAALSVVWAGSLS